MKSKLIQSIVILLVAVAALSFIRAYHVTTVLPAKTCCTDDHSGCPEKVAPADYDFSTPLNHLTMTICN